MTIIAKVIADSICHTRLITLQLRYPRFIHAEFMTHRMFSRNASSSRAIPVERLIQDVIDDPAMPISWGKNQRGMQAAEEHNAPVFTQTGGLGFLHVPQSPEQAWLEARGRAVSIARAFATAGYHKQVVNRLLEPFAHIDVVVTATEWTNFFVLRDHPDADPTIQVLARTMREAMNSSKPRPLVRGEWHLPYVGLVESHHPIEYQQRLSAARCARVSYGLREADFHADLRLAEQLIGNGHYSPLEHQAIPALGSYANFCGWKSFRRELGH